MVSTLAPSWSKIQNPGVCLSATSLLHLLVYSECAGSLSLSCCCYPPQAAALISAVSQLSSAVEADEWGGHSGEVGSRPFSSCLFLLSFENHVGDYLNFKIMGKFPCFLSVFTNLGGWDVSLDFLVLPLQVVNKRSERREPNRERITVVSLPFLLCWSF